MSDDLKEKIARAIAAEQGDDLDEVPLNKKEWIAKRGRFGGRFRDVNESFRGGYLDMAQAALTAIEQAGYVVVPRAVMQEIIDADAHGDLPPGQCGSIAIKAMRSYADLADSATTFDPEEQFEKDNGL